MQPAGETGALESQGAAVFRTKLLPVNGLARSGSYSRGGGIPECTGNSPGDSTRRILVCELLVCKLGIETE